jgi:hypothetical protein
MNSHTIIWMSLIAYSLHILEEYTYNWKDWAVKVLKLPVDWTNFYMTNAIFLFLGVGCGAVGFDAPWLTLAFPAGLCINAVFFHVMPSLVTKVYSPGTFSAVVFYFPLTYFTYKIAGNAGVSAKDITFSWIIGALFMAWPIVLLKTKNLPFFNVSARK